ncbi:ead/Ea22-like family protein [Escherichia coli]|uniref:ead/Ea22-like family protein n=1 Tax=Escherichia coli TaxID=562 RepID=UPI001C6DE246|nr:ead/Ea22-like family protein [Escherichia coli]MBW8984775.1 ead/Ea22-like family protein [Escherichia coli]
MSKIDYQALREAAVAIETVATPQKLLAFRMKVTPQVVLVLLDELEAKDKAWSAQDNHINQQAYRIESLEKKNGELGRSLEAAEKRIAELEKSEEQLINERDHAESALADMYFAATGDRPEWSNWFGFSDAVDAVVDRIADLEAKQCIEEMSKQSCEARERDLFESWVMHSICISKSTLEGLRTETGYRNATLSGTDFNRMWEQWKSIRAAGIRIKGE